MWLTLTIVPQKRYWLSIILIQGTLRDLSITARQQPANQAQFVINKLNDKDYLNS